MSPERDPKLKVLLAELQKIAAQAKEEATDAIDEVHTQLKLGDITQSCFGLDRKRLLERVPEAEPYLYATHGESDNDTRGKRVSALVLSDPVSLPEQPSEPGNDLYP